MEQKLNETKIDSRSHIESYCLWWGLQLIWTFCCALFKWSQVTRSTPLKKKKELFLFFFQQISTIAFRLSNQKQKNLISISIYRSINDWKNMWGSIAGLLLIFTLLHCLINISIRPAPNLWPVKMIDDFFCRFLKKKCLINKENTRNQVGSLKYYRRSSSYVTMWCWLVFFHFNSLNHVLLMPLLHKTIQLGAMYCWI